MRSYLLDELSSRDAGKIREYLERKAFPSGLENIFWIPLPDHLLTDLQRQHEPCHPLSFAVEVGREWVRVECLVRSRKRLACECQDYADRAQMDFIVAFADRMIRELGIQT